MEKITMYRASDGRSFETEDKAIEHEKYLSRIVQVGRFMDELLADGRYAARYVTASRGVLELFNEWQATGKLPPADPRQEVTNDAKPTAQAA